jgi:hypothetical protein
MLIEQYIFITVFFTAFAFFIYIHIAYPFWAHMPVSHTYDIHHKFYTSNRGICILQTQPYKNKWVSTKQVKTTPYYELDDDVKNAVLDQLNCNYIPSDSILFAIEKKHLDTIFSGHFDTPFVSIFTEKVNGCICSFPVHILYRQEKTSANHIVFLACNKGEKDNAARKLIATHEYNSRNRVTQIKSSIIKKHTSKCKGVKPLLEFTTHLYYMGQAPLSKVICVTQVYKENWSIIFDIADLMGSALFEYCAYIDVGALKARIDAGQMWIFVQKTDAIYAVYFIEDAMMLYENVNDYGGRTLNLVGSICNMQMHNEFARGFMDCVGLIQKQNRDYTMLLIDDVGHNKLLVKNLSNKEIIKTEGAYYFINGLTEEPINGDRALMVI